VLPKYFDHLPDIACPMTLIALIRALLGPMMSFCDLAAVRYAVVEHDYCVRCAKSLGVDEIAKKHLNVVQPIQKSEIDLRLEDAPETGLRKKIVATHLVEMALRLIPDSLLPYENFRVDSNRRAGRLAQRAP
jgi:hypothetical protein